MRSGFATEFVTVCATEDAKGLAAEGAAAFAPHSRPYCPLVFIEQLHRPASLP
jgi:hypothetical protein